MGTRKADMEVALVRFIGAGILALASGYNCRVPSGAMRRADGLIAHLAASGSSVAATLLATSARDIWGVWRAAMLPADLAKEHLEALPLVLEECRLPADAVIGYLAQSQLALRRSGQVADVAGRVASQLIHASSTSNQWDQLKLSEPLAQALLQSLFASLLGAQQALNALRPSIGEYLDKLTRSPAGEVARDAGTVPTANPGASTCSPGFATVCPERAEEARKELVAVYEAPEHQLTQRLLYVALARLDAGDWTGAAALIADAEQVYMRAATDDASATEAHCLAADLCRLRAVLEEVGGYWRSAAAHYAQAARLLPPTYRFERWRLRLASARALTRQGETHDDINALFEAAQVHAEAGSLVSEQDAPIEWAQASMDLGQLLLLLGEREGRPERFLAAALHFKPAVDVFSNENEDERWANAQIGLAHSLRGQGEFQGDIETLNSAVFAYRAALGVLQRDRHPVEWLTASASLGITLARIGEEAGDIAAIEEAVPLLKAALTSKEARSSWCDEAMVRGALGRALLALAATREQSELVEEAVALLRRALDSAGQCSCPGKHAVNQRALGTALWALAEPGANAELFEEAAAVKSEALRYYESVGDEVLADRVREELAALQRISRGRRGLSAAS